jgi:uncharacterized linocin/CFP29 family protein
MNFLKRELAPLVDEAWNRVEEEAVRVLKANLSARHVVDFIGPKGFDFSALNLGKLEPADEPAGEGLRYGIRKVLPLVELRAPFELDIWELDNLARGAEDVDTAPVVKAARELAAFEERAIYLGFERAGMRGLIQAAIHEPLALGADGSAYPDAVARAMLTLSDDGVGGPYALILGSEPFRKLSGDVSVYPPRTRIAKMIEGPILHSPVLEGGLLLSMRGGDFQLIVGQDASIGYDHHDSKMVRLYLTETFTFRVLGPEAIVTFRREL